MVWSSSVKISLGIQGIQVFIKYSTWDFCVLAVTKQQLRCFNLACLALLSLKKELLRLTWHNLPWTLPPSVQFLYILAAHPLLTETSSVSAILTALSEPFPLKGSWAPNVCLQQDWS